MKMPLYIITVQVLAYTTISSVVRWIGESRDDESAGHAVYIAAIYDCILATARILLRDKADITSTTSYERGMNFVLEVFNVFPSILCQYCTRIIKK